jgi:peptidoglycan-associated lipoprotein
VRVTERDRGSASVRGSQRLGWGPTAVALGLVSMMLVGGCAKKQPPISRPAPPPSTTVTEGPAVPTTPTERVPETPPVASEPRVEEGASLDMKTLDELNRDSPLRPVFFAFDSAELDEAGQQVLKGDAEILQKYPNWVVTVEGHCDERGTAEYNLALGERRALAARNYLVSLGAAGNRLRTVSYGNEFPFDPAHNEEAWARNRRAHFVITSK